MGIKLQKNNPKEAKEEEDKIKLTIKGGSPKQFKPKVKRERKEPEEVEKQEIEDRSFLDVVRRELKTRQKKVIENLEEFEKLQRQKLASGRKTFIDNSVVQFRAQRDMLDQLVEWIDNL